jgi:hypothetical protein
VAGVEVVDDDDRHARPRPEVLQELAGGGEPARRGAHAHDREERPLAVLRPRFRRRLRWFVLAHRSPLAAPIAV